MNEKRRQATAREKRRMEKLNKCIEDLRVLICPLLKVITIAKCYQVGKFEATDFSILVANESKNIGMHIREIAIFGVNLQQLDFERKFR